TGLSERLKKLIPIHLALRIYISSFFFTSFISNFLPIEFTGKIKLPEGIDESDLHSTVSLLALTRQANDWIKRFIVESAAAKDRTEVFCMRQPAYPTRGVVTPVKKRTPQRSRCIDKRELCNVRIYR
ncbi:MAG: hypothetical protein C0399_12735, partial [Syntrophus sp. (in: bacteria)]|nr:hypothetical protein [Syntrophus sp. (in: bacteria)]